ncbi:hypothetical protein GOBAR_DD29759 [Gossypium barbadense]|nr:hypothetical protein GOBAR_DD29759 [Gossypium barbadense]
MAALTEFFSHLYTMTVVFFTLLLLEVAILIRSLTGGLSDSEKRLITTTQYLKFIEEKKVKALDRFLLCYSDSSKDTHI